MAPGQGRLHYIDTLRAALMMLGVVLHSAQVFNPRREWLIHGSEPFAAAAWIVDSIQLLRMPAFFIVAGFFCVVSLRRMAADAFARQRLERLGVPLLTCALLLNSLQALVLDATGWWDFDPARYWFNGLWMQHLWFLNNLLLYAVVVWWVARNHRPTAARITDGIADRLMSIPITPLLAALAAAHLAVMKVGSVTGLWALGIVGGVFDLMSITYYAPLFTFGLLAALRPEVLRRFAAVPPMFCVAVVAAGVACFEYADTAATVYGRAGAQYLKVASAWFGSALCFNLFRRYADRRSALTRYLSDASYTVYLFHHLLVVVLAIVLVAAGFDGPLALPVLVVAVIAATLAIHRLVAASPVARYLFNGARPRSASIQPAHSIVASKPGRHPGVLSAIKEKGP